MAVPEGIRPMLDRERERLYAIIGPDIEGARVLDLFSGTGAVGFEALSRGAALCVSVENGRKVLPTLKKNRHMLAPGDRHRLVEASAFDVPPLGTFDLAIAAPPFPLLRDERFRARFHLLFGRVAHEWLIPGGVFVLEMPEVMDPAELTDLGPAEDSRRTASSRIAFWSRPVSA